VRHFTHTKPPKKAAVLASKLKGATCKAALNKAVVSKVNVLSAIKEDLKNLLLKLKASRLIVMPKAFNLETMDSIELFVLLELDLATINVKTELYLRRNISYHTFGAQFRRHRINRIIVASNQHRLDLQKN
jgi:hypothetical protein